MRISVVIPVFNRARLLPQAVESVLATGYDDLEVLIVDDGSSDGSLRVARELSADRPHQVRALHHSDGAHLGISESRNAGIRAATGAAVSFLDSDDAYFPHRFCAAPAALSVDPNLDATFEPVVQIREEHFGEVRNLADPKAISPAKPLVPSDGSEPRGAVLRRVLLNEFSLWVTPAITIRRSLFDRTGLFPSRFSVAEDTHLWLRMAAVAVLSRVQDDTPVAAVRRHFDHSWEPSAAQGNRQYTLVLIDVLRWARKNRHLIEDNVLDVLEEGVFKAGLDALGLLQQEGNRTSAALLLPSILRAVPRLAFRNLLWRKALVPNL